jgi:hypothetical protein
MVGGSFSLGFEGVAELPMVVVEMRVGSYVAPPFAKAQHLYDAVVESL